MLQMKKVLALTLALLATTSFVSCSKDMKDSPDRVYRETIDNPALGANSGLGETTPPISESIGTSLDLFNGPKVKRHKLKVVDLAPAQAPVAQAKVEALPQEVEEKVVPNITVDENLAVEINQDAAPVVDEETKPVAEVTSRLVRAPRIPADKIDIDESEYNKKTATIAPVAEPVVEKQTVKEEVVATAAVESKGPVDDLKIVKLDNNNVEEKAEVQKTEVAKEEVKPAIAQEKPAIVESKPVKKIPASFVYRMRKDAITANTTETKAEEVKEVAEKSVPAEVAATPAVIDSTSDLPPVDSANIGQCYSKATIFGETKDVEENILVKDGYQKTVDVPAEYKEVEEEIVVKEASSKMVNIPATYKEVEEEVVISPERTEEVVIAPAQYKNVSERVLIHPAQKKWVKQDGSEIMKLVEEPELYETVNKKVLISEEKRETRTIAAVTKAVKKKVMDQEAKVEKQVIPAETKTIKKQVLVNDAMTKTIDVPAEYKTIKKKVAVTADKREWMPVACGDALSKDTVKRIQGALIAKGFDLNSVDGVIGNRTAKAIDNYQASIGFASEGIALKTLESLGVAAN